MFDALKDCAKIAEEPGIPINLEALNVTTDHVGNFLTSTRMAAELTALVGHHMQLNKGGFCDSIRSYTGQMGHIHVADAPGRHEPGTGEINYRAVLACLQESGYRGLIDYKLFPGPLRRPPSRPLRSCKGKYPHRHPGKRHRYACQACKKPRPGFPGRSFRFTLLYTVILGNVNVKELPLPGSLSSSSRAPR